MVLSCTLCQLNVTLYLNQKVLILCISILSSDLRKRLLQFLVVARFTGNGERWTKIYGMRPPEMDGVKCFWGVCCVSVCMKGGVCDDSHTSRGK